MSNPSLDKEFSYLSVQDMRQPPSPKLPPALQPRARMGGPQSPTPPQNLHPQTYRAVPAIYKPSVRSDEDLPPPPPNMACRYTEENFPPPPPPPELSHGHPYMDRNDTYNLPPPPPVGHDYDPSSLVYSTQPNYGGPMGNNSYDTRPISITAHSSSPNYHNRDVNKANYVNQTEVQAASRSHGNVPNYTNAAGCNPSQPQLYNAQAANVPQLPYPGRPAAVTLSAPQGSYCVPTSRSPQFESTGSLQKSDVSKKAGKEAEVDALTSLLMQNIESAGDPDFFGMCSKCGRKVVGQSNGCTAMDQVFHINCFICASCGTILRGKSFYAIETKPYCEPCYVNTLEKCSVCSKPVIDRLLRATGKPYHPACFTCVVCGKSLDGVPFTVDATNQIHCIEDFHKKFAPRCCVCQHPIMPDPGKEETVRVVAMDKSFHVHCYRCEDCGLMLSSEAEGRGCYPLDDHILCKNCNAKRIQTLTTKMTTEL